MSSCFGKQIAIHSLHFVSFLCTLIRITCENLFYDDYILLNCLALEIDLFTCSYRRFECDLDTNICNTLFFICRFACTFHYVDVEQFKFHSHTFVENSFCEEIPMCQIWDTCQPWAKTKVRLENTKLKIGNGIHSYLQSIEWIVFN